MSPISACWLRTRTGFFSRGEDSSTFMERNYSTGAAAGCEEAEPPVGGGKIIEPRLPPLTSGGADALDCAPPEDASRQADWRFLLPCPSVGCFDHLVLLGGPRWLPDVAVELGLARRVSRAIPPEGSADALVILHDAEVDFAEASVCLSRGGAVYWEVERRWSSFFRSTPRAIRRRLLETSLTPVAIYWPRPDFRHATMFLPIDARGILDWYLGTLRQTKSFARSVAGFFSRLLVRAVGNWLFGLLPRYAVTATAGPADRDAFAMRTSIRLESFESTELLPLILLRGWDLSRRVIIFLFPSDAERPSAVVKFWRVSARNAMAEEEQAILRRIRSLLDAAMCRTVPQPLGTARWGGIVAAIESYVPGQPLSFLTNASGRSLRQKLEDFTLVSDWISEFDRQAEVSRKPWDQASLRRWVEDPVARYRSAFRVRPAEERLLAAVHQRARALLGMPLPVVWAHPDLNPANVLIFDHEISVIDWSGAAASLPLFDFLYFVMLWARELDAERGLESRLRQFRAIFIARGKADAVTMVIREAIRRYLNRLAIDSRFFPILLTLARVDRSLECHDRERAVEQGDPGANPYPGETSVEYLEILGEEVELLFSEPSRAWWSE